MTDETPARSLEDVLITLVRSSNAYPDEAARDIDYGVIADHFAPAATTETPVAQDVPVTPDPTPAPSA
jgi:hypothetical protein